MTIRRRFNCGFDPTTGTKICSSCERRKDISKFRKNKHFSGGVLAVCSECKKRREAELRANPVVREQLRLYLRGRKRTETEMRQCREFAKADKKTHPEKFNARAIVNNAIQRGTLIAKVCCEECGANPGTSRNGARLVEAHHDDYSEPLAVRWLCRICHKGWHMKNDHKDAHP